MNPDPRRERQELALYRSIDLSLCSIHAWMRSSLVLKFFCVNFSLFYLMLAATAAIRWIHELNPCLLKLISIFIANWIFVSLSRRGHVDSFPNRGIAPQPGCEKLDVLTVTACSHYRAPVFFAESILIPDSFPAYQCELSLIQSSKYRNCLNGSNVVSMGEHIDRK